MRSRFILFSFSALTLFAVGSSAIAAPIHLDFTATLDQPVAGSTTATGSFWYESSVATPFGPAGTSAGGTSQTAASLNLGGQTYSFPARENTLGGGSSVNDPIASFAILSGNSEGKDVFQYSAARGLDASDASTSAAFGIRLEDPTGTAFAKIASTELPAIDLSGFSAREFAIRDADGNSVSGTITSLTVNGTPSTNADASVPEPSTLVVLSVLAAAGIARARFLRARHG